MKRAYLNSVETYEYIIQLQSNFHNLFRIIFIEVEKAKLRYDYKEDVKQGNKPGHLNEVNSQGGGYSHYQVPSPVLKK
jgi:hypothetical protein